MTDKCDEDYRTCGHCKVQFEDMFPLGGVEAVPVCDKAGFWRTMLGNNVCPNASREDKR